jgi:iron(III) transport system permease protein
MMYNDSIPMSRLRQFWSIILPLTLPYALVLGVVIFLMVLGDLDSVLLVSPPGYTTIPVRVYNLMHYGPSAMVSSMALLMVMVFVGVLTTLSFLVAGLTRGRRQFENS